jgi:hypothetical protein
MRGLRLAPFGSAVCRFGGAVGQLHCAISQIGRMIRRSFDAINVNVRIFMMRPLMMAEQAAEMRAVRSEQEQARRDHENLGAVPFQLGDIGFHIAKMRCHAAKLKPPILKKPGRLRLIKTAPNMGYVQPT